MPVADRQRYFRLALTGYLEAAAQPRESLLVVAEPSIAILFFYGIARLLPPELRTELSFSTFEAAADRLVTALAALTFDDEQAGGDVPEERYKRGFTINTWLPDRASPLRYTQGRYADVLLSSLIGRPDADAAVRGRSIDGLLAGFQAAGVRKVTELEATAQAHAAVAQILQPEPHAPYESWRKSPQQKAYVATAVRQQLCGSSDPAVLDRFLKSPGHLPLVFEIALGAADGPDGCGAALNYLVERIEPLEQLDPLLGTGQLARHYKLHALRHYVAAHHRLPDRCRWLWTDQPAASPGSPPLPVELLHTGAVTSPVLRASLDRVPDSALNLFFRAVLTGPFDAVGKHDVLARITARSTFDMASLVAELKDDLTSHAAELRPVLLPRLHKILMHVPDHPERFAATMDTFEASRPIWFGDPAAASIQGWLELERLLDGYQQAGEQQSVLALGAKGPQRWEFEDQAGTCLAPCLGTASGATSPAEACQRLARFGCSLTQHYGIGYCLAEESETYLSAVLRQDTAARQRIRESAEVTKTERTTRRLNSVTKIFVGLTVALFVVLFAVFWRR